MKKSIIVIIVLIYSFLGVNMPYALADTWTQKTDFGGIGRSSAVGFSIGSKGYIGTGSYGDPPGYIYLKDFWEYDPSTNAWTQKADFGGTARDSAVGFSIGSKGYIGTGGDESLYKDFWEYDPSMNTWTKKADFGGTARWGAVGFSIGSKGYIGTGDDDFDPSTKKKDFWEYDPSANAWTQKADFGGLGRYYAVGFSIGNKGYIGTGATDRNDFWEYDPSVNIWSRKADLAGAIRIKTVGFSIGSNGYIATGDPSSIEKEVWEYNPDTNAWTQKTDFGGTGRRYAVGFSVGSKGYIGTGYQLKDFWEYDPTKPTCSPSVKVNTDYFNALQDAYNSAASGNIIQISEKVFNEDILLNRDITNTLKGGYDCGFDTKTGFSTVDGTVTIKSGTVTVDGLIIK